MSYLDGIDFPIAHWNFSNPSGTGNNYMFSDQVNNIIWFQDFDNFTTKSSGNPLISRGISNSGLFFLNGSGYFNDSILSISGSLAYGVWVANSFLNSGEIFKSLRIQSPGTHGFTSHIDQFKDHVRYSSYLNVDSSLPIVSTSIHPRSWNFYYFEFDESNQTIGISINGQDKQTIFADGPVSLSNGFQITSQGQDVRCEIDEFSVFASGLTNNKIKEYYSNKYPFTYPGVSKKHILFPSSGVVTNLPVSGFLRPDTAEIQDGDNFFWRTIYSKIDNQNIVDFINKGGDPTNSFMISGMGSTTGSDEYLTDPHYILSSSIGLSDIDINYGMGQGFVRPSAVQFQLLTGTYGGNIGTGAGTRLRNVHIKDKNNITVASGDANLSLKWYLFPPNSGGPYINYDVPLFTNNYDIWDLSNTSIDVKFTKEGSNTDPDKEIVVHSASTTFHGTPVIETGINLYEISSESVNSGVDLYIQGFAAQTSGIDLYMYGFDVINSSVNLYMNGELQNETIPLYTYGYDTIDSGINLYIDGITSESSGIDLFTKGLISYNESMPLYMGANPTGTYSESMILFLSNEPIRSTGLNLFLKNEYTVLSSSVKLFTRGLGTLENGYPYNESMNLYISRTEGVEHGRPMFIKVNDGINSGLNMYVHGANVINSSINLVMPSTIANNSGDLNLFTHGF